MPEIPAKIVPEVQEETIFSCKECPNSEKNLLNSNYCTCRLQPHPEVERPVVPQPRVWTVISNDADIPDWCPLEDAPDCSTCNGTGWSFNPNSGPHVDPMCNHCEGSGVEMITAYAKPAMHRGDDELVLMLENSSLKEQNVDLKKQIKNADTVVLGLNKSIQDMREATREINAKHLASSNSVTTLNNHINALQKSNKTLRDTNAILLGVKKMREEEKSRKLDL